MSSQSRAITAESSASVSDTQAELVDRLRLYTITDQQIGNFNRNFKH